MLRLVVSIFCTVAGGAWGGFVGTFVGLVPSLTFFGAMFLLPTREQGVFFWMAHILGTVAVLLLTIGPLTGLVLGIYRGAEFGWERSNDWLRRTTKRPPRALSVRTCNLLSAFAPLVAVAAYALVLPMASKLLSGGAISNEAAIETTLKWARLEPFPESATDRSIEITGSPFTRGFRIRFVAPAEDIEGWLQRSAGPREAGIPPLGTGTRKIIIKPGGGAQWAEITIDDVDHSVTISTYWS
ncbi:MAG: hypothetical protein JNL96_26720 [Planctomycetaceae bacterium]|nr:hypothetical protein [Planctomycetaceae bacterium]